MKVFVVESVSDCDGGYLPNTRRIQGIFESEHDAHRWVEDNESEYENYEVTEYKLDALLGNHEVGE